MNIVQGTAMERFVTLGTSAQDIRKSADSHRDEIFYYSSHMLQLSHDHLKYDVLFCTKCI